MTAAVAAASSAPARLGRVGRTALLLALALFISIVANLRLGAVPIEWRDLLALIACLAALRYWMASPARVLDEIGALDLTPEIRAELLDCINLNRQKFHVSILLIEHDMSLVMKICERIIVLDYGCTIASGTPAEIAGNKRVIAAYLGEEDEEEGSVC